MRIWRWRGINADQALDYILLNSVPSWKLILYKFMGLSTQVHRLLYETLLPLINLRGLSWQYGRVASYVGGLYYIIFYLLCYILYFIAYLPQFGNPGSTEFPQPEPFEGSATLSSSFSEKWEVDTLSEHFDTHVSDMKGVFWFCPLPCDWFLERHPGIWFHGSRAKFPFLFVTRRQKLFTKGKQPGMGPGWQWRRQIFLFLRGFQDCHLFYVGLRTS